MADMVKNRNLRKHALAVEAIMGALCRELRQRHPEAPESEFDAEEWRIVGLLHDADYELVEKDPDRHTLVTEERLQAVGAPQRIIDGVKAHHEGIKPSRDTWLEKAVYAADELSGLIIAVALVRPDKKLASVTVDSVLKKFPEKAFAAGARREQILACERELDIPLEEFVDLSLKAMQGIAGELGL
ncbi:MAG: HDIG domain-containing protein [Chloroflexi bacterium]|nr:HDIG domain-containing protein [Chloroflexota bacterium]